MVPGGFGKGSQGEGSPLVSSSTLPLALPLTVCMNSGHPPLSPQSISLSEMKLTHECHVLLMVVLEKPMELEENLATERGNTHRLAGGILLPRWLVESDS